MSKRYELLKDSADAKAGTVFTLNEETETYEYGGKVLWQKRGSADIYMPRCYYKVDVENNPEWFRPLPEEEFVWTDELLEDLHYYCNHCRTGSFKIALQEFKQLKSKQP